MARAEFKSVDEYITSQPGVIQEALQRVRTAIRTAVPAAVETISYKMPTYKLGDKPVLYFAGWKKFVSLYPATATVVAHFAEEITPYFDSKSTLRFPLSQPVPVRLIERIAEFRAKEVSAR